MQWHHAHVAANCNCVFSIATGIFRRAAQHSACGNQQCEDGALFTWGRGRGLGHGDGEDKRTPTIVAPQLLQGARVAPRQSECPKLYIWEDKEVPTHVTPQLVQGARVGRCHSLPPMLALAFAMGTHPWLRNVDETHVAGADTTHCAYSSMLGELVQRVVQTCVSWPE